MASDKRGLGHPVRVAVLASMALALVVAGIGPSWAAPPGNDAFSSAEEISSLPANLSASNLEATLETDEPQPSCSGLDATLWYRVTPTEDGTISVDTLGSDHDTVVAVYTGTSMASLNEFACNDEGPDALEGESQASFAGTAGTTYHIQAGAWWAPGNLVVNVSGPGIGGGPTPDPSPSASVTPTASPSAAPSPSPSVTPSASPSPTPSASASPTPTPGPSPTASPNPSPGAGPMRTTLHTKKKVVDFDERFILYGRVIAGSPCIRPFEVHIRKESSSGTGRSLGSVRTGRYGYWHMDLKSTTTADYTAAVTGSGSCYVTGPEVTTEVAVRAAIDLVEPDRCNGPRSVRGRVAPAHPGTFVYLAKKRAGEGWTNVTMDRLDDDSRFKVLAPRCGLRYRVLWPSQSDSNHSAVRIVHL